MGGITDERTFILTVAAGGVDTYFALLSPRRGYVAKLVVAQAAGTSSNFTADLYSSKLANPANSALLDAKGNPAVAAVCYQVVPTQTITAGNAIVLVGSAYGFQNMDATDQLQSVRDGALWLRLNSVHPGTYHVGLTVAAPLTT